MKKYTLIFFLLFCYGYCDAADVYAKASEIIRQLSDKYNIPAYSIGIVCNGDMKFLNSDDVDESSMFLIGSVSKSFTALALMKLNEQGKLDINSKVKDYLKWFRYKDRSVSERVSIKDLLNHRSGISRVEGMYKPEPYCRDIHNYYRKRVGALEITLNQYGKYEYSNLNYQIAGLIVEEIAGMPFAEYLKKEVFELLGMGCTVAEFQKNQSLLSTPGYQHYFGIPFRKQFIKESEALVPSGFIASTTYDMCLYIKNLIDLKSRQKIKSVISSKTLDELLTPGSGENGYCMGWEKKSWCNEDLYYHLGLNPSFASSVFMIPDRGLGVVVLTNINCSDFTIESGYSLLRVISGKSLHKEGGDPFILKRALPVFTLWSLFIMIARFVKWYKLSMPVQFSRRLFFNFRYVFFLTLALVWLYFIPQRFSTPWNAIIEYEPDSGYFLLILIFSSALSLIVAYFLKVYSEVKSASEI